MLHNKKPANPSASETAAEYYKSMSSLNQDTASDLAATNKSAGEIVCGACQRIVPADASTSGICPRCLAQLALAPNEVEDSRVDGTTNVVETKMASHISWLEESLPQFEDFLLVGQGGAGEVFRATQRSLDRDVAIKLLSPEKSANPDFVQRFHQEAVALGRLNHPLIVGVHEFGEVAGRPYFVMEMVEGVTLRDLLCRGPIDPQQTALIVWLVCTALQYAHEMGIAHRDIKPENILVDEHSLARHLSNDGSLATNLQGSIKVTDFGLARILEQTSESARLTSEGHALGTPYYMAPEQRFDPEIVDGRADIYAVGVLFYEMLTGTLPQGHVRPPSEFCQVGGKVDQIVFRCVESDPANRYQSVRELIRDLESVSTFKLPQYSTAGWSRTTTAVSLLVVTCCLSIAGLVVWFESFERRVANTNEIQPLVVSDSGTAAVHVDPITETPDDIRFPVAADHLYAVKQFGKQLIRFDRLLTDETGFSAEGVTVTCVTKPNFGTLTQTSEGFIYSPTSFFAGLDSFVYRLDSDGAHSPDRNVDLFVTARTSYDVTSGEVLRCAETSLFAESGNGTLLVAAGNSFPPIDPRRSEYVNPTLGSNKPVWRYRDNQSPPPTGWERPEFDDSSWKFGSGEFGYSEKADDAPVRTVIDKVGTAFFRLSFDVEDAERFSSLTGHLLRDDGAAVYLNGVEVVRQRLMAGAGPGAWSLSKTSENTHDESVYFPFRIDPQLLQDGRNVIAVEVHQHDSTSRDCSFDFAMTAGPLGLLADSSESLSVHLVKQPAHGKFELNADGKFLYSPYASYCGADQFSYAIERGDCVSNAVSVDLRVHSDTEVRISWNAEKKQQTGSVSRIGVLRFSRIGDTSVALNIRYSARHTGGSRAVSDYTMDLQSLTVSRGASDTRSKFIGTIRIPAGRSDITVPVSVAGGQSRYDQGFLAIQLLPSPFYRLSQKSVVELVAVP